MILYKNILLERTADNNYKSYSYDTSSNRILMQTVAPNISYSTSYVYDINNRLLTETKNYTDKKEVSEYFYDKNGNMTEKFNNVIMPTTGLMSVSLYPVTDGQELYEKYTYNTLNQLVKYEAGDNFATYSYRPDGLRYSKNSNDTITYFGWQGDNIVTEFNGNEAVKNNYVRGANLIKNNGSYYLFDGHNDTVQLTDTTGKVTKNYEYDAFGNEKGKTYSDTNPFRYCGEYYDTETGFIYLRARYYDPTLGSFVTEDPAFDGVNWYSYCGGNPVRFVDPSGLKLKLDTSSTTHKSNNKNNVLSNGQAEKYGLQVLSSLMGCKIYSDADKNLIMSDIKCDDGYSSKESQIMLKQLYDSELEFTFHFGWKPQNNEYNCFKPINANAIYENCSSGGDLYFYFVGEENIMVDNNGNIMKDQLDYGNSCSGVFHEIRHAYGYSIARHISSQIKFTYTKGTKPINLEEALVTGLINEKNIAFQENYAAVNYLNQNNYDYNNGFNENSYREKIGKYRRVSY